MWCLTVQQSLRNKARRSSHMFEPEGDMRILTRAALAGYFSLLMKTTSALLSLLKE
jgi:hypothetical protein